MYVKNIHQFCQVLKKMNTKENWFLFSSWYKFMCLTIRLVHPAHSLSILSKMRYMNLLIDAVLYKHYSQ